MTAALPTTGAAAPAFAHDLCCPACRGPLTWGAGGGHCPGCARAVTVRGAGFFDFIPEWTPAAASVLRWPDGFVGRAGPWLLGLRDGRPAPPAAARELAAWGLVDDRGGLSSAGRTVAYHLAEFGRQVDGDGDGDGVGSFCEGASLGPGSRVLDVGCGAGQTLKAVGDRRPAGRTGVDINPEALALGTRLLGRDDPPCRFVRAAAHALPFPDDSYSHVVCRVALNYMRQGPALAEMVRVLRPGGFLYCRVEGPGFDLMLLRQRRGGNRRALGHARNLFWGSVLELVGWQPEPGRRLLSWDRAFATSRRLGKALRAGCSPVRSAATGRYLGLPLGAEVVVRKRP